MREDGPVSEVRDKILYLAGEEYGPAKWRIPEDFLQYSHFLRAVDRVHLDSSPGYPYVLDYVNNGQLLGVTPGKRDYSGERLEWLWRAVESQIQLKTADPIRLFVKPEPHKQAKLDTKRYRLISSVSLVDQLIDHMLFGDNNDRLIETNIRTPSKAGWTHLGGGYLAIPNQPWLAIDKSSWDWTVQPWLLDFCLDMRVVMCENMNSRWLELARMRYRLLFDKFELITSGGTRLRSRTGGVQKSGCVNTIADNCLMQWVLHARICFELNLPVTQLYALGDDTLQQKPDKYEEYLALLSQFSIVKTAVLANEFAGNLFLPRLRIEPMYWGKHAFNMLHVDPKVKHEMGESYSLLYSRSARLPLITKIFRSIGVEPMDSRKSWAILIGDC